MRRKRYDKGGLTEADIAAGLTQADIDAGLRAGRNERISEEDRRAALRSAGMAQSFPVAEPAPKMRQGLSDLEAAKLMGREVRQPAPSRNVPSPRSSKASALAFEANYPVEKPPYQVFEGDYPSGSRYHNESFEANYPPGKSRYQAFEENYPGPRQVRMPPNMNMAGRNVGFLRDDTGDAYPADVMRRIARAEANAPLARDMIDSPAKARLMRAIAAASNDKYARDAMNARLVAQQIRSDFDSPYSDELGFKKGGRVKKMTKGGSVKTSSASKRADGIAQRGKTKGRMV